MAVIVILILIVLKPAGAARTHICKVVMFTVKVLMQVWIVSIRTKIFASLVRIVANSLEVICWHSFDALLI